jgi:hypothetical protein
LVKIRLDEGAWETAPIDNNYQIQRVDETRIGYAATAISQPSGEHVDGSHLAFFTGDPTGSVEYAALIAELVASPFYGI